LNSGGIPANIGRTTLANQITPFVADNSNWEKINIHQSVSSFGNRYDYDRTYFADYIFIFSIPYFQESLHANVTFMVLTGPDLLDFGNLLFHKTPSGVVSTVWFDTLSVGNVVIWDERVKVWSHPLFQN